MSNTHPVGRTVLRWREPTGFTIVELLLVMAISSALGAMVLVGFSTLRGQAQFSASVEQLKETVLAKRTEALSTVKLSGGTDAGHVTLGKLLTFHAGTGTVQVDTLQTINSDTPTTVTVTPGETTTYTMDWGLTYQNYQLTGPPLGALQGNYVQVAFVRSALDGTLITTVSTGTNGFTGRASGNYQYAQLTAANGPDVNLNIQDPSGRKAWLLIDPPSNGVERKFQ